MHRFHIVIRRRSRCVPRSPLGRVGLFVATVLGGLTIAAVIAAVAVVGYLVLGLMLAVLLVAGLVVTVMAIVRGVRRKGD